MTKAIPNLSKPDGPILTKKQRAFIENLIITGGKLEKAAILAGYSKRSAQTQAYLNLRLPHVLAEYRALLIQRLGAAAAGSLNSISDLSTNAQSEAVKLAASKDILDRMGLTVEKQHQVGGITINIGLNNAQSGHKTIDATAQRIDEQGIISAGLGDSVSPEAE